MLAFCPEHPKRDQNPKFTPLSEMTSIPVCFIWESPLLGLQVEILSKHGLISNYLDSNQMNLFGPFHHCELTARAHICVVDV